MQYMDDRGTKIRSGFTAVFVFCLGWILRMAGVRTFEVNVFVKKYAGLMLRSSSAMFSGQFVRSVWSIWWRRRKNLVTSRFFSCVCLLMCVCTCVKRLHIRVCMTGRVSHAHTYTFSPLYPTQALLSIFNFIFLLYRTNLFFLIFLFINIIRFLWNVVRVIPTKIFRRVRV